VLERAGDIDHATSGYVETGRMQDPAEVQEVVEQETHVRLRFSSS